MNHEERAPISAYIPRLPGKGGPKGTSPAFSLSGGKVDPALFSAIIGDRFQ